jgi:hypothetical protein
LPAVAATIVLSPVPLAAIAATSGISPPCRRA